jgi:hypothetical protein
MKEKLMKSKISMLIAEEQGDVPGCSVIAKNKCHFKCQAPKLCPKCRWFEISNCSQYCDLCLSMVGEGMHAIWFTTLPKLLGTRSKSLDSD